MGGSPAIGLFNHIRLAELTSGIERGVKVWRVVRIVRLSVYSRILLLLGSVLSGEWLDGYRLSMYVLMSVKTEWIGGCAEGAEVGEGMRGGWKVQSSLEGERRVDEWEEGCQVSGREAQRFCVSRRVPTYLGTYSSSKSKPGTAILSYAVGGVTRSTLDLSPLQYK